MGTVLYFFTWHLSKLSKADILSCDFKCSWNITCWLHAPWSKWKACCLFTIYCLFSLLGRRKMHNPTPTAPFSKEFRFMLNQLSLGWCMEEKHQDVGNWRVTINFCFQMKISFCFCCTASLEMYVLWRFFMFLVFLTLRKHLLFPMLEDRYGCFRSGICHLKGAE